MRKHRLPLVSVLSLGLCLASTQASAQVEEGFGERVDVHLVTVEVAVESRFNREPISGLTQESFTVWEDGEQRLITHFERVEEGRVEWVQGPGGEQWRAPAPEAATVPRSVGLGFDFDSLRRPYLKRTVNAARRFVESESDPETRFAVIVMGDDPYFIQPFTADRDRVSAALDALDNLLKGDLGILQTESFGASEPFLSGLRDPSGEEVEGFSTYLFDNAAQSEGFLRNLESTTCFWRAVAYGRNLSELFRGWPRSDSSKSLVLFYEPEAGCVPPLGSTDGQLVKHRFANYLDEVSRVAVGAGIKVYATEATGLQVPPATGRKRRQLTSDESPMSVARQAMLEQVSERTGGRRIQLNDLSQGLELAKTTSNNHYRLSFQVDRPHDQERHDLEIKVDRPRGALVRHPASYTDEDARTQLLAQLNTSGRLPKTGGSLPVDVLVGTGPEPGGPVQATLSMPLTALSDGWAAGEEFKRVEFFLAVYDLEGTLLALESEQQKLPSTEGATETVRQSFSMDLPSGDFIVAVAALDAVNGKVGLDYRGIRP